MSASFYDILQYGQDLSTQQPLYSIHATVSDLFSAITSSLATEIGVAESMFDIMFEDPTGNTHSFSTDPTLSFASFNMSTVPPLFYIYNGPQQANYDLNILNADNTTKCNIANISNLAPISELYSRVAQATGAAVGTFSIYITQNNTTYTLAAGSLYDNGITGTSILRFQSVNSSQVICFLADAPVLTPDGYKKIATLREGDLVTTGDGRAVAIQRVSRTRVATGSSSVNPYCIPKGKFGATRRLLISPDHKVHTDSGAVEAKFLGLKQESMTGPFMYYNLELPNWSTDSMVVAGVQVESLAPVRRITVSPLEFVIMIKKQYGTITPQLVERLRANVKMMTNGSISVPVMAKK